MSATKETKLAAELDDIETKLVDGLVAVRRARVLLGRARPARRVERPDISHLHVSDEALEKATAALAEKGIT